MDQIPNTFPYDTDLISDMLEVSLEKDTYINKIKILYTCPIKCVEAYSEKNKIRTYIFSWNKIQTSSTFNKFVILILNEGINIKALRFWMLEGR